MSTQISEARVVHDQAEGSAVALYRIHNPNIPGIYGFGDYTDEYTGYDMLLYVNTSNDYVLFPKFGVGTDGYIAGMNDVGWQQQAMFGGGTPGAIGSLRDGQVFATLVPTATTTDINLSVNSDVSHQFTAMGLTMVSGDVAYLSVPEPTILGGILAASSGLLVRRRQKKVRAR